VKVVNLFPVLDPSILAFLPQGERNILTQNSALIFNASSLLPLQMGGGPGMKGYWIVLITLLSIL